MLYHVVRRSPTKSPDPSKIDSQTGGTSKLMPRYHYSRIASTSPAASSESFFPRHQSASQSSKPTMTATTTSNSPTNHNPYSYATFKSTFIPLVTNQRISTGNKRESVAIPITREDGTIISENPTRSVPITFVNSANALNNSTNNNSKSNFTSFLRPNSKYFQSNSTPNDDELTSTSPNTSVPRLPSVSRRLSLTVPVVTNPNSFMTDDETVKSNVPPSPSTVRQIPIQFPQTSNPSSTLLNNQSRTTSASLRSMPRSNSTSFSLQKRKTDLNDTNGTEGNSSSPARRAEIMAREAIQGVVRFQEQQQQQQGNQSTLDSNNNTNSSLLRSPSLSRRVIINLKNNQSVSLDSRLLSASPLSSKPPLASQSPTRLLQRANLYHTPVTTDVQIPPHPVTRSIETPPSLSLNNSNSYKNELRMEIPVTFTSNNDQENINRETVLKDDGFAEGDDDDNNDQQQSLTIIEPLSSANSNQTLKSILKRSSSREAVSRKNVSFVDI